jgi:hypothetical protein
MDRQAWDTLFEPITALEAKRAAQAAQMRAQEAARRARPAAVPRPLRLEQAALYHIAMVCKAALGKRAVRREAQPYFEQIAQRCREVVQRRGEDV